MPLQIVQKFTIKFDPRRVSAFDVLITRPVFDHISHAASLAFLTGGGISDSTIAKIANARV